MANKVSAATRSGIMARVKSKNTLPEMAVRKALHVAGYGFSIENICGVSRILYSRVIKQPFLYTAVFGMGIIANSSACQLQTRSIGKKRLDATN
jgi:hypothetical protein